MKLRVLILTAVALGLCFVPAAAKVAQAKPYTTEPDVYDDVDVTITDSKITLTQHSSSRGNGVNFHVHNVGKRPHNFTLIAPKAAIVGLGAEGLGTGTLKPGKTDVLQVYMDYEGAFTYRSTLAADRAKPGMHGKYLVTACIPDPNTPC